MRNSSNRQALATCSAIALAIVLSASAANAQVATRPPARRHGIDAKLRAEAKISEDSARHTALQQVPKGKIESSELEREKGKLIYSFDIKVAGKSGIEEVNVDATNGSVVAHEHESPKAEKKEAAQEAKEKKHLKTP